MHVLITGAAGYVGSMLCDRLVENGYDVTAIDKMVFGNHIKAQCKVIEADILNFDPRWLDGVDAVVHLAAISNDPMAAFRPGPNFVTNTAGTALLAFLCRERGVSRFVYASTCSVYGYSTYEDMVEDSQVRPSFPYGISKVLAEKALLMVADNTFQPFILRKATVFGWAHRMRYDLVVNTMTKWGVTRKQIVVNSPDIWRPLVHIRDVCDSYVLALEAEPALSGIYNITNGNYQIIDIAKTIASVLKERGIDEVDIDVGDVEDYRDYRVCGDKAEKALGFRPKFSVEDGVREILDRAGSVKDYNWDDERYLNHIVYRQVVEREEKKFALWADFIRKYEQDMDHLASTNWPQEGP